MITLILTEVILYDNLFLYPQEEERCQKRRRKKSKMKC